MTLVQPVSRVIRQMSANQPVERAATLEDIRADVLAPERLNAFVFSGFAGVALLIAVVGVAGVLAFGVSARTREFGVRLAVGSTPRHLLDGRAVGGSVDRRDRAHGRRRRRLAFAAGGRSPISKMPVALARALPIGGGHDLVSGRRRRLDDARGASVAGGRACRR